MMTKTLSARIAPVALLSLTGIVAATSLSLAQLTIGSSYTVGQSWTKCSVGDVTGDLIPDIVAADRYGKAVVVLTGNGDGTFTPGTPFSTSGEPLNVRLFDAEPDGDLDFVSTMQSTEEVQIFLNDGSGNFTGLAPIGSPWVDPSGVDSGDFNGDMIADLAVTTTEGGSGSARVYFLEGQGDGTFVHRSDYFIGDRVSTESVLVRDWDGDGDEDAVINLTNGNAVKIVTNDGGWNFTVGAGCSPPALAALNGMSAGDFNEDGLMDVVSLNNNSHGIAVFLRSGASCGFDVSDEIVADWSLPAFTAVADFNSDCHVDIAVGDYGTDQLYLLMGDGAGNFSTPGTAYPIMDATFPVAGDLNGDGGMDLVVAQQNGDVTVLMGTGSGYPVFTQVTTTVGAGWVFPTVLDYNGDAVIDLAVSDREAQRVRFFGTNFDGTLDDGGVVLDAGNPLSSVSVDANLDMDTDLVVVYEGTDEVKVYAGDGQGNFCLTDILDAGAGPQSVEVGDFDGDQIDDLVVASTGGGVNLARAYFFKGQGDGTYSATGDVFIGDRTGAKNIVVGDFDQDMDADVAVALTNGAAVVVLLNDGAGAFSVGGSYGVTLLAALNNLEGADLDNDGHMDLFAANNNTPGYAVFLGQGDGTFVVLEQLVPTWGAPRNAAITNLNDDCWLDVALADPDANQVHILLGQGDGTFSLAHPGETLLSPIGVRAADIDGDLRNDLIVAQDTEAGGLVTILLTSILSVVDVDPNHPPFDELTSSRMRVGPNPSWGPVGVTFQLETGGPARIEVFDAQGARRAEVLNDYMTAGTHTIRWDGRGFSGRRLPAGQYYIRIEAEGVTRKGRVTLIS